MQKIALLVLNVLLIHNMFFSISVIGAIANHKEKILFLENKYLNIQIDQGSGGRIKSLIFRPTNIQLVDKEQGCLSDNFWNIQESRFFLNHKAYRMVNMPTSKLSVDLKINAHGGGIDFLELSKKISIYEDNASIIVDYKFFNMPAAMASLDYGLWFHNKIGVVGKDATYYYPTERGIVKVPLKNWKSHDRWFYRPARGWMASSVKNKSGVAILMDYSRLQSFYSWFGDSKNLTRPTMEWRFEKLTLKEKESFKTQIQIIPFYGLASVSGAGKDFVGSLDFDDEEVEEGDVIPLDISIYSSVKQNLNLEIREKKVVGGKWKVLGKKTLKFKNPATVQKCSMDYTVGVDGGYAIEIIVRNKNKEVGRLNGLLVAGDLDGRYKLKPLKSKITTKAKKIDLTKYDLSIKTPHIKWAKPYSKGKIKLLVLTGYQNIPEVAELNQRISLDANVVYLSVNNRPIYSIGDDYGRTTQADIYDNLNKKLKENYDVILIGAVPWDYFPTDIQTTLENKIKAGTGLVYIDPTYKKTSLQFISPLFNDGKILLGKPKAVKKSFLTNGIPFELFPDSYCRVFETDGNVLASVNNHAYLASKDVGQGKSVALGYKALGGVYNTGAGLTPEFDNVNALQGNYWEYYFSLLSKAIIYTANRQPDLLIDSIVAKYNKKIEVKLNVSSQIDSQIEINIGNRNCYSKELSNTVLYKQVVKGNNQICFEIPAVIFNGMQTLDVILKNKNKEVLNWASTSILVEAQSRINAIKFNKPYYINGDVAEVKVDLKHDKNQRVKIICQLYDSYNRLLFDEASLQDNLTFVIPLQNKLMSRQYKVKILLSIEGKIVDRLEKTFIVMPTEQQLVWNDYEPGIWITSIAGLGMRHYLLPELAHKLHELKVRTIIANDSRLDKDFAVKFNFNPTTLHGIGLERCEEPANYLKTGDKMQLVRTPCLSDSKFLNKCEHAFVNVSTKFKKYGLRFYWLGDELSITGYDGKPVDFCFSKEGLVKFRSYLKDKYQTLDNLNNEWQTTFSDWASVLPMTRQEAILRSNKNYAPWADHLNFVDSRLEAIVNLAAINARKGDAYAKVSMSGTQPPTAYGGMDWWRMMKVFDGVMSYSEGGQRDLQRSFKPNGDIVNWAMGYSIKGHKQTVALWKTLFMGEKGAMSFHSPSVINPDMSFSTGAKDCIKTLKILTGGLGKHYINNLKAEASVAILYSQASIRAAFLNKQKKSHQALREKYISLCRNVGVNFNFISYEQLSDGDLNSSQYKVLVLLNATALSKAEITQIEKFSDDGGIIIAEGMPALMDENCKPFSKPQLKKLFTKETNFIDTVIDTSYKGALLYPNANVNKKIITNVQNTFINRLKKAGVKVDVVLFANDGELVRDAEIYLYNDAAKNKYIGVITDASKIKQTEFKFDSKYHIYELRTHKYLGYTDYVKLFFNNANPYVFALLKDKLSTFDVDVSHKDLLFNVIVSFSKSIDSVVAMRVINPKGQNVSFYNQNILLKNGKGYGFIPFVQNDIGGTWTLEFKDIITGQIVIKQIELCQPLCQMPMPNGN